MFEIYTLHRSGTDNKFHAIDPQTNEDVVLEEMFPSEMWDCPEAFKMAGIRGYEPMTAKELDTEEKQDFELGLEDNILEEKFNEEHLKRLGRMCDLLDDAFKAMTDNLKAPYTSLKDITNAQDAEYNINEYRNTLREEHIINIEENPSYNYQLGVFYMDIVAELEKMGDFIINVSEAKIAENG